MKEEIREIFAIKARIDKNNYKIKKPFLGGFIGGLIIEAFCKTKEQKIELIEHRINNLTPEERYYYSEEVEEFNKIKRV